MSKVSHKSNQSNYWIDEIQNGQRFGLKGKILFNEESAIQQIKIVETSKYGKGLLLDDCWMTTEFDEKYYHESLVHPAMCCAENIENILIIGGGDGGSARECLRYKETKRLDLIEIDSRVVELSEKYLPNIGAEAWKDSRLHLRIEDGVKWVKTSENNFYDVIIVDSSDPKGPAKGLFNQDFYENCQRILKNGGVFSAQTESPTAFKELHIDIVKIIRNAFNYADPLYGCVPTYPSGYWSWTFAAQDKPRYLNPIAIRTKHILDGCEIWSPRWQNGAFHAIPNFIEKALQE